MRDANEVRVLLSRPFHHALYQRRFDGPPEHDPDFEELLLRPGGKLLTATFELEGQRFMALNGGPHFKFTEAISLFVTCESQQEVDYYWERLLEGGSESQCGWLKDKFGLSWQIIPTALMRYLSDPDPKKAKAAMDAMLKMKKIVIADLEKARAQA